MKWMVLIALLLAGSAAFFFTGRPEENHLIDRCLDHGGCWDYDARICRKEEPNAQALCDASKS